MPRGTTVDPTFLDLTTKECICLLCHCGQASQHPPYQLIGAHGVSRARRRTQKKAKKQSGGHAAQRSLIDRCFNRIKHAPALLRTNDPAGYSGDATALTWAAKGASMTAMGSDSTSRPRIRHKINIKPLHYATSWSAIEVRVADN